MEGNVQRDQARIAYLPQQLEEHELFESVSDFMMRDDAGNIDYDNFAEVKQWLGKFNNLFEDLRFEEPLRNFSGGERIKIQLARLLTMRPELLILDEPTRNLSPLTLPVIENMLDAFHGAILTVSHDRRFLRNITAQRYLFNADGLHDITQD